MNFHPTLIERLDGKHPGLEKEVCDWMKSYMTGEEIAARLLAKYKEVVNPRTINSYRERRVNCERARVQKQKEFFLGFMEAVGEKGLDAGAAAKLWEALQSMTPSELIALRRLQVERARVKVLDKRAENEMQRLKAKLGQLKDGGEKRARNMEDLRRTIDEIYGIGTHDWSTTSTPAEQGAGQPGDERAELGAGEDQGSASEGASPESDDQDSSGGGASEGGVSSAAAAAPAAPREGSR